MFPDRKEGVGSADSMQIRLQIHQKTIRYESLAMRRRNVSRLNIVSM